VVHKSIRKNFLSRRLGYHGRAGSVGDSKIQPKRSGVENVFEVLTDRRRTSIVVAGKRGNGIECPFLIIKPTFKHDRGKLHLLLDRTIELCATESPHVPQIQSAPDH
jgi:hypothetical protein